jgi:hypothetical protein
MWAYLNELAYATYYYEYILEVAYGNRYVVRFGQLKRTAPTGELCVVKTKGWKSLSSRLDRGKMSHLSTDHVDILDVSRRLY